MLSTIAAKVITWFVEKMGVTGLMLIRKALKYKRIDDVVGGEVAAVRDALKEAKAVERSQLVDGRLPKNEEDRLRETTRRLKSGFLG